MFRAGVLGILILSCLSRSGFADDIDQLRLQGVWKAVKYVENGTAKPVESGGVMTIKGNRILEGVIVFENRRTKDVWTSTLKWGTGVKRNNLDLVLTCQSVDAKGGMVVARIEIPGIYRLEAGDNGSELLVICMGEEGGERPIGFEPKKGQTQWTYKKVNLK